MRDSGSMSSPSACFLYSMSYSLNFVLTFYLICFLKCFIRSITCPATSFFFSVLSSFLSRASYAQQLASIIASSLGSTDLVFCSSIFITSLIFISLNVRCCCCNNLLTIISAFCFMYIFIKIIYLLQIALLNNNYCFLSLSLFSKVQQRI